MRKEEEKGRQERERERERKRVREEERKSAAVQMNCSCWGPVVQHLITNISGSKRAEGLRRTEGKGGDCRTRVVAP